MSAVDWRLLIGYSQVEALEYLKDENVPYVVSVTKPPYKEYPNTEEFRVIAVRQSEKGVELICAAPDWSVS